MVFQFPNFILLWGCAITLFSDFALLCFNMIVLHTAVVPWNFALPPKILPTTRLLHEPEESFCSLFSPPLHKLQSEPHIPQDPHISLELSPGYPTDFENNVGVTLFLLLLWSGCNWSWCYTDISKREHLHKNLNYTISACKFGSYVCSDNKTKHYQQHPTQLFRKSQWSSVILWGSHLRWRCDGKHSAFQVKKGKKEQQH